MYSPSKTDELISKSEIKDVSSETELPPIFTPTSVDTEECIEFGTFYFKGKFDKNIEEGGLFQGILLSGSPVTCYYNKTDKDVEVRIKCLLEVGLLDGKIIIDSLVILGTNTEKFLLRPISTEETFTCPPGMLEEDIKFFIDITFRQVSKFEINQSINTIIFYFYAFVTLPLYQQDTSIMMNVSLIKGNELESSVAFCTLLQDSIPVEGEELQADFECRIEGLEDVTQYSGLEVVSSDQICGFPTNPELLNPATVDKLINAGKVKDYSLEENKIEQIPLFIPTFIDTTDSAIKGNFYIYGGFLTEFTLEQSFKFEIFLMTGEKAICTFPKINLGDIEIQIECVLQQELIDSKIMIEKYSILDGYTEIIRLNRIATELYWIYYSIIKKR